MRSVAALFAARVPLLAGRAVLLIACVAPPVSWAQEPERPAAAAVVPPRPDGAQQNQYREPKSKAHGTFQLIAASSRLHTVQNTLGTLLVSSETLRQEAIRNVSKRLLQDVPDPLPDVSITALGGSISSIPNQIVVQSFDERIPAADVLVEYVKLLGNELASFDEPDELKQRIDRMSALVIRGAEELAVGRERLVALAKQLHVDVDPQVAAQRRLQVATEIQRLQVEREGLSVRQALMQDLLARLVARGPDKEAEVIIEELSRVVQARKQRVAQLTTRFNTGSITADELEPAKAELAQAEVELAKFQREAMQGNSQRAAELRHRLEDTEIQLAELHTKLTFLEKMHSDATTRLETERLNLELEEQSYRRMRQELDQLQAELRSYVPPQLKLIRTE